MLLCVEKFDSQLFTFLNQLPTAMQETILIKLVMQCALHCTFQLSVKFELGMLYLTQNEEVQAFVCQQLLSVAVRATTNLFSNSEYDSLYKAKFVEQIKLGSDGVSNCCMCCSQSLEKYMCAKNEANVVNFIQQIVPRYNEICRIQGSLC